MDVVGQVRAAASQRPLLATILTLVAVFALQLIYRGYKQRRFYRNLPGPPHSWLFGHLKALGEVAALLPPNCHPQLYYTELARKYNLDGIYYLDLWPVAPPSIVLLDPKLMDEVTVVKPLHQHPFADALLTPMVGSGVVATANGPLWKKLHNSMLPAFSWAHIRSLAGLMVDECQPFRRNLDKLAETGEVFSLEQVGAKLVFDIITRVVFNFSLHAQTKGSQDLEDLREMITLAEGASDITVAYNPVAQIRVWWRRRQVLGRLHPSMISKIYERFSLLINEQIVPSRKDPNSILDLMLREHVQAVTGEGKANPETAKISKFEEGLLLTNIKGLLLGGHGTTTDSLCYLFMLLSKSPHIAEKMRQEHNEQFDPDFQKTMDLIVASPEKLQSIPYTEAVIKETLRLFPVGFGVKEAAPGGTLMYNGQHYPIDNSQMICVNGHAIHYNERHFPNPTEFAPERWLGPEEIPRSNFRTFSRGPRACLGQNLAMNELKIILIMTMRDYTFECVGLKPNAEAKITHTNLDTVYGDIIFQELALEAKPRGGMMMTVKKLS
ncbi:cytochrome P450 [Mariannaea sp. PMI_226]|nr:cytochrome P450 [Mariannaea sp. PMI_226]